MKTPAKPYPVVYFGTPDFAATILKRLHDDPDFKIVEVVTRPDKPAGRGRAITASPVKRMATLLGLPVYQPESLKSDEVVQLLKRRAAAVFLIAAYGKMIPRELLEVPPYGCINVHGSLLPKYRGASPIAAAIAAGEMKTGITIMKMDEKLDEGPILAESTVQIREDDDTRTLTARMAEAGAELAGPTLKLYLEGRLTPKPQDYSQATYTKILRREDGKIDWRRPAEEIERLVRAMRPWPEAFCYWKRKSEKPLKLAIKKASVISSDAKCDAVGRVGAVCRLADGTLGVNCVKGSLAIQRLQIEGKPEIDAKSFLNGYPDFVGAVLE